MSRIIGILMIVAFFIAYGIAMARMFKIGWREVLAQFALAIALTAFLFFAVALAVGRI